MLSKLRNYSKIIIIIVAVAMVASAIIYGSLYNSGAFKQSANNNNQVNVAKVNGTDISEQQYYSVLQNQLGMNNISSSQEIPFRYNILNAIIERELLLQQADKLGIKPDVTDEDVQQEIDTILKNNEMTEEDLVNYLQNQNSTMEQFKDQIRESLKLSSRIEQVQEYSYKGVSVSEEEVARSYEKVQVQVIMKNFADDKEAARTSIKEALDKINGGSDFAEIGKDYSDLGRVDLGMIGHDNSLLPEDILNKAFSMEKNTLSDVVEGEDAFYVIKVLDKKIPTGEDYDKAKEDIRKNLLQQKQNEAFSNWLQELKDNSDITINDPLLNGYKAFRDDNFVLAISELQQSLDIMPIPMTYVYLAESYLYNDQLDKAIETYDKALDKYPDNWEMRYYYATSIMDKDGVEQSKITDLLEKASELAGDDYYAHYQIYAAYSDLGVDDKAKAEMDKMNELMKKMQEQQQQQSQDQQGSSDQGTDNQNNDTNSTSQDTSNNQDNSAQDTNTDQNN